jgi:hypothetical protein
MEKELADITDEDIEKKLKPLLKNVRTSPSKFAVRYLYINLLKEKGIELSKEDVYKIHMGDNKDSEYIQRINKFMINKRFSPSTDSYDRLLF